MAWFCPEKFLWCMSEVNSLHVANVHNFSSLTGGKRETADSSQESNVLHGIAAEGVFKDTEVIKKHPRNWSVDKWDGWPHSDFLQTPITGDMGRTNHFHHIPLQHSWQGSVALHSLTTSAYMAGIWGRGKLAFINHGKCSVHYILTQSLEFQAKQSH